MYKYSELALSFRREGHFFWPNQPPRRLRSRATRGTTPPNLANRLRSSSSPAPPPEDAAGRSPCGRRRRRGLSSRFPWICGRQFSSGSGGASGVRVPWRPATRRRSSAKGGGVQLLLLGGASSVAVPGVARGMGADGGDDVRSGRSGGCLVCLLAVLGDGSSGHARAA
jgi:hypothetical protein